MPPWHDLLRLSLYSGLEAFRKWFTVVERIVPTKGFINGLPFPTLADFACLLMVMGQTPYVGAGNMCGLKQGGLADYPKFAALVQRIKAVPEVTAYLQESRTMGGNPFGLPETTQAKVSPSAQNPAAVGKKQVSARWRLVQHLPLWYLKAVSPPISVSSF